MIERSESISNLQLEESVLTLKESTNRATADSGGEADSRSTKKPDGVHADLTNGLTGNGGDEGPAARGHLKLQHRAPAEPDPAFGAPAQVQTAHLSLDRVVEGKGEGDGLFAEALASGGTQVEPGSEAAEAAKNSASLARPSTALVVSVPIPAVDDHSTSAADTSMQASFQYDQNLTALEENSGLDFGARPAVPGKIDRSVASVSAAVKSQGNKGAENASTSTRPLQRTSKLVREAIHKREPHPPMASRRRKVPGGSHEGEASSLSSRPPWRPATSSSTYPEPQNAHARKDAARRVTRIQKSKGNASTSFSNLGTYRYSDSAQERAACALAQSKLRSERRETMNRPNREKASTPDASTRQTVREGPSTASEGIKFVGLKRLPLSSTTRNRMHHRRQESPKRQKKGSYDIWIPPDLLKDQETLEKHHRHRDHAHGEGASGVAVHPFSSWENVREALLKKDARRAVLHHWRELASATLGHDSVDARDADGSDGVEDLGALQQLQDPQQHAIQQPQDPQQHRVTAEPDVAGSSDGLDSVSDEQRSIYAVARDHLRSPAMSDSVGPAALELLLRSSGLMTTDTPLSRTGSVFQIPEDAGLRPPMAT